MLYTKVKNCKGYLNYFLSRCPPSLYQDKFSFSIPIQTQKQTRILIFPFTAKTYPHPLVLLFALLFLRLLFTRCR